MFICCVETFFFEHSLTLYIIFVFHYKASPAGEEQFFKIREAQTGRLADQGYLPPGRSTPVTPTHNGKALNNNTGQLCIVLS